jgi:NADPH-dependent curcumin reductase CurA
MQSLYFLLDLPCVLTLPDGIAGGQEKCEKCLSEFKFDGMIDYKKCKSLSRAIHELCPQGIDVFFDNVGGKILEAALSNLRRKARVVLCGSISEYNSKPQDLLGPRNYMALLIHRARMEGFVVFDYAAQFDSAAKEMIPWIQAGKLKYSEHVLFGLDQAPQALGMLFTGQNQGKMIIQLHSSSSL